MSAVAGYATTSTADPPDYRRALTSSVLVLALVLSTLAAVPALQAGLEGAVPAASADKAKDGASALSGVRLAFEPNRGQADPRIDFSVKAGGASVYFTDRGVTNVLARAEGGGAWVVKQRFVGTAGTEPRALARAPGTVSYFRGSPEDWITDIPTHQAIVYRDLWPGIDMVWRGLRGALEYRFVVHPGADPSRIRLTTDGATGISVGTKGALQLKTPAGDLSYAAPVAYQPGADGRAAVGSAFALRGDKYGFHVGRYDATRTLVIDPTIVYAGYIGGSGNDWANGVAVDSSGAAYVAGRTSSTAATFPVAGGPDLSHNGGFDAFVAKVSPSGASLAYAGYIGGSSVDQGLGVAVDSSGAAYVAGFTESTEATFPVTGGPDLIYNGSQDAFVAKVAPSGASLDYAGYIGGASTDQGSGIAVDSSGAAYVAGLTSSGPGTFPVIGGPDLTHNGFTDAFVAKVAPSGASLDYAGYIGGGGDDQANEVAVDSSGAAYVVGATGGGLPVIGGPDPTYSGGGDAFVAKVTALGTALAYAGYIGGSGFDQANGVAVDSSGAAYVAGRTGSTEATFPVTGGPDLTHNGGFEDAFAAKVAPSGGFLAYAGYIGGSGSDWANGVAVDSSGAAYVAGFTESTEGSFPVTGGPDLTHNGGSNDAFVAKVAPSGGSLAYAGYIGGSGSEQATGVAVDSSGAAYVAGLTFSTEATFPVTGGPDLIYNGGAFDAFVAKVAWTLSVNDVTNAEGTGGTTNFVFTLQLSTPSDGTVTVDFVTLDGTAKTPADYAHRTGTRTFLPGQTQKKVTVPVVADVVDEALSETFTLQLLDAENAVVIDDSGTGTIVDDDPEPAISIGNAEVTEGAGGTSKLAKFTVSLSAPSSKTVTVNYATANDSATAPSDYVAINPARTLTFLPGVVTKTIKVKVKGDNQDERDETFFVNLSEPTNAVIEDGQGVGTILDDDP
jgi:hypothetical protein